MVTRRRCSGDKGRGLEEEGDKTEYNLDDRRATAY
jgi:hypothetical protein